MASGDRYDAIVIGLGGMGSATLHQLALRGKRALGIEQFGVAHDLGSSHGVTRIIRLAYYEDPAYVPLLRRAYELWRELEQTRKERILHITGSLDMGPPGSLTFEGSLRSCEQHELPHEALTSAEVSRRFPGYRLPSETMAVYQPEGGFLRPERCVRLFIDEAQRLGARARIGERVLEWQPTADGVRVRTGRGEYEADRLVVTAGAWASSLLPQLRDKAVPERQVLAWLEPRREWLFTPDRFPVFNLIVDEGKYYGFPVYGIPGFKFGRFHHLEEVVDPDEIDRSPNERDEAMLRQFAEKYFPDGAGATSSMKACMFTNSPDEHFIIDRLADAPQVVVGAGFSGHGFKFSSVVGEILADLALEGGTRHDIGMFGMGRFSA